MFSKIKKRWQQIKQQIIMRKVPHAIFSWRYFAANQRASVRLHKKVFCRAWPTLPRPAWALIALYSYTLWYLIFGWQQLSRVWRSNSPKLKETEQISRFQQLRDLLYLTFVQTTPPFFYYKFKLYQYPKEKWLDFVYTHELPHWHQTWSPNITANTHKLMSDKSAFARYLSAHQLPAVNGELLKPLQSISDTQLFQGQPLFFKPQQGCRKQGCFILHFHKPSGRYSLTTDELHTLTARNEIAAFIQSCVDSEPYLLQPLLENHSELSQICPCEHLITFRIVTTHSGQTTQVVSANLEWPQQAHSNTIFPVQIDIVSGTLQAVTARFNNRDNLPESLTNIAGTPLPCWQEMKKVAAEMHLHFPDLYAIGWDLVLTAAGVKVLEGNINWGVDNHQLNGPDLLHCYHELISKE